VATMTIPTLAYTVRVWRSTANGESTWLAEIGFWVDRGSRRIWTPVKLVAAKDTRREATEVALSTATETLFAPYKASNIRTGRA
jgi:hypothetical protein